MVLVQGANGQGKSNLLEAIYILAVAKSHRASTERQLIRRQSITNESFAQIAGSINREGDTTKLQVDFSWMTSPSSEYHDLRVKKYVHINGIRRRGSELVGEMNAVLFTADDLNLVYGSPTIRRRYLDILISQTDREYLKTLQRYQRIVTNRNHLLKEIRDRRSKESELTIWDDQLADAGALILTRRANTLARLSDTATQTHKDLSNVDEILMVKYQASIPSTGSSPQQIGDEIRKMLEVVRSKEIAQGVCLRGAHRDDFMLLLGDTSVNDYASRGQARTVILALKLAEAQHLQEVRGSKPIILLDDVLSELDTTRRSQVLERATGYEQTIVTTADIGLVPIQHRHSALDLTTAGGKVSRSL